MKATQFLYLGMLHLLAWIHIPTHSKNSVMNDNYLRQLFIDIMVRFYIKYSVYLQNHEIELIIAVIKVLAVFN